MTPVLGPAILGVTGFVMSIATFASAHTGGDLAPYINSGGTATLAAGMIWVVKRVVSGELVPRNVSESTQKVEKLHNEAIAKIEALHREALSRESALQTLIEDLVAQGARRPVRRNPPRTDSD